MASSKTFQTVHLRMTGSIFRINPEDGSGAPDNPFTSSEGDVLSKYYAYGVRNSFGMDFDPLTGTYGIQKMALKAMMK